MDSVKYVCEPHYDENGKFDYWNPLFPYKRDTCEGCVFDGIYANNCAFFNRDPRLDDQFIAKVVE